MNACTLEQCKQWLMEKHPDKHFMIRPGLRMGEEFSESLKRAIIDLAKTSKLNTMRAEKIYGININDAESPEI